MKIIRNYNHTLTIDLHGMRGYDAKIRLENLINSRRIGDTQKIVLIHGFNGGTVLRDVIRNELSSERIKKIKNGSNSGETVIILKSQNK